MSKEKLEKQVDQLKKDIQCHWTEISQLQMLMQQRPHAILAQDIEKIKKLIVAKQDLLKTLAIDYKIGSLIC